MNCADSYQSFFNKTKQKKKVTASKILWLKHPSWLQNACGSNPDYSIPVAQPTKRSCSGHLARSPAFKGTSQKRLTQCQYATGWDSKLNLQFLSHCGSTHVCLVRSVPEKQFLSGTLNNWPAVKHFPSYHKEDSVHFNKPSLLSRRIHLWRPKLFPNKIKLVMHADAKIMHNTCRTWDKHTNWSPTLIHPWVLPTNSHSYIYTYTHERTHTHTHANTHSYTYTHARPHTHKYTHTLAHIHIHARTNIHVHTNTHANTDSFFCKVHEKRNRPRCRTLILPNHLLPYTTYSFTIPYLPQQPNAHKHTHTHTHTHTQLAPERARARTSNGKIEWYTHTHTHLLDDMLQRHVEQFHS